MNNVTNTDTSSNNAAHEQDSFSYSSDANELFNEISSNFDSHSLNRNLSNDNLSHNINHSTHSSSTKSKTPTSPNKAQEHFSFQGNSPSNYQINQLANLKSGSSTNFGNLTNGNTNGTGNGTSNHGYSSVNGNITSTGPTMVSSSTKTSFYTNTSAPSNPSHQPSTHMPLKSSFMSGKNKQQTYLSNENLTGEESLNNSNNQNHYTTVLNNILSNTNMTNELNNSSSIGSMVNSSNTNVNLNTNTNTVNVSSTQQLSTTNNSIKSVNIINNINRTSNHFSIKIKNSSASTSTNGSTSSSGSSCSTNSNHLTNSPSITVAADQFAKRELTNKSISSGVINNSLGACAGLISNSNNTSSMSINSIQSVNSSKSYSTDKVIHKILSGSILTNNSLPNGNNDENAHGLDLVNGVSDLPKSVSVQSSALYGKKTALSLNNSPDSSVSNLSLKDNVSLTGAVDLTSKINKKTKTMEWCSTQLSMGKLV